MRKESLSKVITINVIIFFSIILGTELILRTLHYAKNSSSLREEREAIKENSPIPTKWDHNFHPGVGLSHDAKDFRKNVNTRNLEFDNLSVTENFRSNRTNDVSRNILILGGSTSDPLGTQYSGKKGTWIHHLFNDLSSEFNLNYKVTNAANGGSTSSNELTRLITKIHSNNYDAIISFHGINEIYFNDNKLLTIPENVLAPSMLLRSMDRNGVIKSIDGKWYINNPLKYLIFSSRIYFRLAKIRNKLLPPPKLNSSVLTKEEMENLEYAAKVWDKNITFMEAISRSQGAKYFSLLQPTLGINKSYCSVSSDKCLLRNKNYISKIRYLYSKLKERCSQKSYCVDISSNEKLNIDDSLYQDPRHPNSRGNKTIALEIKSRIGNLLGSLP